MNLLNSSKAIILLFSILISPVVHAQSKIKICLTGRIVENLKSYGQSFLNAAYLAKEENDLSNKVVIKSYFYNNRPLEPMHIYNQMVNDSCSAIIGFEYLSDLLLAVKEQKNDTIPIFTSYASTTNSDQLPKNIFIFMPSYNYQAEKMMSYLHERYKNINNVLLITEINRDEMLKYKEVYSSILKKEHVQYSTFDFLENDSDIEGKLRIFLNERKYQYVFLLSGAIASAKIANIMNNHSTVFIGTENFGSSVSQTFFMRLNDKVIHSHFIRNLDFIQPYDALTKFENIYIQKFHEKPTVLAAYTYDSMKIILKALNRTGIVNTNSILSTDYIGITGAYLNNGQFYRSTNYVILSVNSNGYAYEK
ncbi:periplasmic binding protein-like [Legionella wadsworthii]|uniref:Periplasmic binding protein-like n=1 Tax=Legionella wadsworthii TaxID=28088 RepID=A0A378P312_9GAMM|nr:ABC transporter substrate-binding protein [Legionella wadsworthii]STY78927.1 periplasmic binding protein-like [Legionella wadsworthii]